MASPLKKLTDKVNKASGKNKSAAKSDTIPEIVKRAMTERVVSIGQLTAEDLRQLNKYVKKGVLIKGLGGPFPKQKTVYAIKGFDIKKDREDSVNEMIEDVEALEGKTFKRGSNQDSDTLSSYVEEKNEMGYSVALVWEDKEDNRDVVLDYIVDAGDYARLEVSGGMFKNPKLKDFSLLTHSGNEFDSFIESNDYQKPSTGDDQILGWVKNGAKTGMYSKGGSASNKWLGGSTLNNWSGKPVTGQKGLSAMKDYSRENPNQLFILTDDNYSRIGTFWLKKGKIWPRETIGNPNYDLAKNPLTMRGKEDVIYKILPIGDRGGFAKGGTADIPQEGDLVFVKDAGMNGLVGLVLKSGKGSLNVYFRGMSGEEMEIEPNEAIDIRNGYMHQAINNADIRSYASIAKKNNFKLNPVYAQLEDSDGEEEFDKGGNAGGGDIIRGQYVELEKKGSGLVIRLTQEGRNFAAEEVNEHNFGELIEDIVNNNEILYFRDLSDAGIAMTSAPGILIGWHYGESDGLQKLVEAEGALTYWYPDYQIKDAFKDLNTKGETVFQNADLYEFGGDTTNPLGSTKLESKPTEFENGGDAGIITEERLETAVEDADLAFWGSIAGSFPEVKSGDLDPGEVMGLNEAQERAVNSWLNMNHPTHPPLKKYGEGGPANAPKAIYARGGKTKNKITEDRFDDAITDANFEFWASIRESFPEIKSGDVDPSEVYLLTEAEKSALKAWLHYNHPSKPAFEDMEFKEGGQPLGSTMMSPKDTSFDQGGNIKSFPEAQKEFQEYKSQLASKYGAGFKNAELSDDDFEKLYELKVAMNQAEKASTKQFFSTDRFKPDSYHAGGTPVLRIPNAEANVHAENCIPFHGNNLIGSFLDNGDYVVLSFGYYPIWYFRQEDRKWFGNTSKYCQATAIHISQSRPTHEAMLLPMEEFLEAVKSAEAKYAFGGEIVKNLFIEPYPNVGVAHGDGLDLKL